jgi:hypothetical protein
MKKTCFLLLNVMLCLGACSPNSRKAEKEDSSYKGTPYEDAEYKDGAQVIPGKIYCAYYDFGGEGVAYHDTDSVNHGSGELNPIDGSYLHSFRVNEGVDISYTKRNDIDSTQYNFVQPPMDLLYVGWTEPGEWVKYTVNVKESGTYRVSLLYTSNQGGKISITVNDTDTTGPLAIPSTYNEADPVAFRQWHHWNIVEFPVTIQLKAGVQTLKLTTEETGQMNYGWLKFEGL